MIKKDLLMRYKKENRKKIITKKQECRCRCNGFLIMMEREIVTRQTISGMMKLDLA